MKCFPTRKAAASLLAFSAFLCGSMPASAAHRPASAAHRRVRRKVKPVYPELAKRMDIRGTVWVEATVAPNGAVLRAKTLRGNTVLAPAAEEAVRKWKFAVGEGRTEEEVEIEFDLADYGNFGDTVNLRTYRLAHQDRALNFANSLRPVGNPRYSESRRFLILQ